MEIGKIEEVEGPAFCGYEECGERTFSQRYSPPKGWFILDAHVHNHGGLGNHNFGLTIEKGNIDLIELRELKNVFDCLINDAESKGNDNLVKELQQKRDLLVNVRQQIQPSNNVVVLSGSISPIITTEVCGIRILEARGHVNLTTVVRIIRFVTRDEVEEIMEYSKKELLAQPQNIVIKGGTFTNTTIGKVSGDVTYNIDQLKASENKDVKELARLLDDLKTAIEKETALSANDKETALEKVGDIALQAEDSDKESRFKHVKTAINALRGIGTALPAAAELVKEFNHLLPLIGKIFGINKV